ncbi:MAG: methyltransferase domain-containing protein [Desulfovibrionaceae bacterium]
MNTTGIDTSAKGVPLPPEDLTLCFGGGDFQRIGRNLLNRMIEWGGLLPSERVLDVGCGCGRAAIPLTRYLSDLGRYEGFDIYPFGVDWCRENVTPRHSNFRFQTVDVFNALYSPFSKVRASEFVFPFEDRAFDFVLLNSVFTHMLPEDVVNYVRQIGRVLEQGGRAYLTYFLLNAETRALLAENRTGITMRHKFGACHLDNPEDPEEAVGYEDAFALNVLAASGLRVRRIYPGAWSGRKAPNFQDVVIVEKA